VAQFEFVKESAVPRNPVREQLDGDAPLDSEIAVLNIVGLVNFTQPAAPNPLEQSIATGDQAPICLLFMTWLCCCHRQVRSGEFNVKRRWKRARAQYGSVTV